MLLVLPGARGSYTASAAGTGGKRGMGGTPWNPHGGAACDTCSVQIRGCTLVLHMAPGPAEVGQA